MLSLRKNTPHKKFSYQIRISILLVLLVIFNNKKGWPLDYAEIHGIFYGFVLLRYTVPKEIDFPRYNMKCSGENVLLRGIFPVLSRFPLHFLLYRGNLDYFSESVPRFPFFCIAEIWITFRKSLLLYVAIARKKRMPQQLCCNSC